MGDVTVATHLGVPHSTARGWLGGPPTVVVGLDVVDLTEPALRLHSLDSVTRVRRLVAFYVDEHNRVRPHSAFSRTNTGRDVLRDRPRRVDRPDVTRGRGAPGTR